jgi:hypothetical protein
MSSRAVLGELVGREGPLLSSCWEQVHELVPTATLLFYGLLMGAATARLVWSVQAEQQRSPGGRPLAAARWSPCSLP